jgi:quercetin dioxygenase-like cupin family protein
VGLVREGSLLFQVEGEEAQVLHAGDAFFEPANVPSLHFDARDAPAVFVACSLLGAGEDDLIRML